MHVSQKVTWVIFANEGIIDSNESINCKLFEVPLENIFHTHEDDNIAVKRLPNSGFSSEHLV